MGKDKSARKRSRKRKKSASPQRTPEDVADEEVEYASAMEVDQGDTRAGTPEAEQAEDSGDDQAERQAKRPRLSPASEADEQHDRPTASPLTAFLQTNSALLGAYTPSDTLLRVRSSRMFATTLAKDVQRHLEGSAGASDSVWYFYTADTVTPSVPTPVSLLASTATAAQNANSHAAYIAYELLTKQYALEVAPAVLWIDETHEAEGACCVDRMGVLQADWTLAQLLRLVQRPVSLYWFGSAPAEPAVCDLSTQDSPDPRSLVQIARTCLEDVALARCTDVRRMETTVARLSAMVSWLSRSLQTLNKYRGMPPLRPWQDSFAAVGLMYALDLLFSGETQASEDSDTSLPGRHPWHAHVAQCRRLIRFFIYTISPLPLSDVLTVTPLGATAGDPAYQRAWNEYKDAARGWDVNISIYSLVPNDLAVAIDASLSRKMRTPSDAASEYAIVLQRPGGDAGDPDSDEPGARNLHIYSDSRVIFTDNSIREEAARRNLASVLLYSGHAADAQLPTGRGVRPVVEQAARGNAWFDTLPGYYAPVRKYANVLYFLSSILAWGKPPSQHYQKREYWYLHQKREEMSQHALSGAPGAVCMSQSEQIALALYRSRILGNDALCQALHPSTVPAPDPRDVLQLGKGQSPSRTAASEADVLNFARMVLMRSLIKVVGHRDCTTPRVTWYVTNYRLFYQQASRETRTTNWYVYDGVGDTGIPYTRECPTYADEVTLMHADHFVNMLLPWPTHGWADCTHTPFDAIVEYGVGYEPPLYVPDVTREHLGRVLQHLVLVLDSARRVREHGEPAWFGPGRETYVPPILAADAVALFHSAQMYAYEPQSWTCITPLAIHVVVCLLWRSLDSRIGAAIRPFWAPNIPRRTATLAALLRIVAASKEVARGGGPAPPYVHVLVCWRQTLSVLCFYTHPAARSRFRLISSCPLEPHPAVDALLLNGGHAEHNDAQITGAHPNHPQERCPETSPPYGGVSVLLSNTEVARILSDTSYMCVFV